MPQPNRILFTLDDNELIYSPDGWDQYGATWKRSDEFFGIDRTITAPLAFVRDGASMLNKEFENSGYEGNTIVKIYENNPDNWEYELNFEGEIDYSTYANDGDKVTAKVLEGGLKKYINANKDNVYEIDIDENYNVDVPRGIYLIDSAEMILQPMDKMTYSIGFIPWTVVKEVKGQNMTVNTYVSDAYVPHIVKLDNEPVRLTLDFAFFYFIETRDEFDRLDGSFVIRYYSQATGGVNVFEIPYTADYPGNAIELRETITFTLTEPGDYELYMGFMSGGTRHPSPVRVAIQPINTDGTPDFKIGFTGSTTGFSFNCLPMWKLYEQLIDKMTDGKYSGVSDLLTNGDGRMLFATSGDAIRGFKNAKVKISFADFFKSVNTALNVGLGVEIDTAILEKKEYFFDKKTLIADLGEVAEMNISVDKQLLFNKLNVGYKTQNYETQLGRDEFNIQLNFEAPVTRNNSTFQLISPMRADSYGVFYTRLRYKTEDNTTDISTDNDSFMIHVEESENGYIVDQSISIQGGSINPEGVFNVFLSPKRCLLRHQNVLAGALWRVNGDIRFISSERQDSNLMAGGIVEKDPISIGSLRNALYQPLLARIRVNVPKKITDLMRNNSRGYYSFTHRGQNYTGFVINVSNVLALNDVQEWTLRLFV